MDRKTSLCLIYQESTLISCKVHSALPLEKSNLLGSKAGRNTHREEGWMPELQLTFGYYLIQRILLKRSASGGQAQLQRQTKCQEVDTLSYTEPS